MEAKIYQFPMKGTKILKWLNAAKSVKVATNHIGAKVWVTRNVPRQFRQVILNSL